MNYILIVFIKYLQGTSLSAIAGRTGPSEVGRYRLIARLLNTKARPDIQVSIFAKYFVPAQDELRTREMPLSLLLTNSRDQMVVEVMMEVSEE